MSELLDAALGYARRGFPVFPLKPGRKIPLFPTAHPDGDPLAGVCKGECGRDGHGLYDATIDLERVRAWWTRTPRANIGVRTGIRFDVLDPDGAEGIATLKAFLAEHGLSLASVPWVSTPGGGYHGFFEPAGLGCKTGLLPKVDWKGAGGYLVVGPSVHPNGGQYRMIPEGADRPGFVPGPLRALLEPPKPPPVAPRAMIRPADTTTSYARAALEGTHRRILAAPPKLRNDTAFSEARGLFQLVAGAVVDDAAAVEVVTDAMRQLGKRTTEIGSLIRSARVWGAKRPRGIPADPPPPKAIPAPGTVLSEDAWAGARDGKALVNPTRTPPRRLFPTRLQLELYRNLESRAFTDAQGRRVARARLEQLATAIGRSPRRVQDLLADLRTDEPDPRNPGSSRPGLRLGYLRVEPLERTGKGKGGAANIGNLYLLLLHKDEAATAQVAPEGTDWSQHRLSNPDQEGETMASAPGSDAQSRAQLSPVVAGESDAHSEGGCASKPGTTVSSRYQGEGGGFPQPVGGEPPAGLDGDLAAALEALAPLGPEVLEVRPNEPPPALAYQGRRLDGDLEDFHRAVGLLVGRDTCRAINGMPNRCGGGLRCGRHTRKRRSA